MKCFNCGSEVDENGRFCGCCGSELHGISRCVLCGKNIPSGNKICRNCLKENKKRNKKSSKGWVIVLIILLAIALVAGGCWFWSEWQDVFYTKNIVSEDYEPDVDRSNEEEDKKDIDENVADDEVEHEQWEEPFFEKLEASSEYASFISNSGKRYTYYVNQIRDDEHETAWSPERGDKKPWIKFSDESEQRVSGFIIENGYSKTEDLYYQNLRAKDILIECDGFKMNYTLTDMGCQVPETVKFEEPVITKTLKITFLSVYDSEEINGIKYEDLSITEIDIF